MWWPSVQQTGEICLDILKTTWSPAWTLQSVCRAILALLSQAEPDSPLNCDAGVPALSDAHHLDHHLRWAFVVSHRRSAGSRRAC